MGTRIIARITPQAWINDDAIEVDPPGETEWDATEGFNQLDDQERERILEEWAMSPTFEALDSDDALKQTPAAPEWVHDWSGPFDIYVRREDGEGIETTIREPKRYEVTITVAVSAYDEQEAESEARAMIGTGFGEAHVADAAVLVA